MDVLNNTLLNGRCCHQLHRRSTCRSSFQQSNRRSLDVSAHHVASKSRNDHGFRSRSSIYSDAKRCSRISAGPLTPNLCILKQSTRVCIRSAYSATVAPQEEEEVVVRATGRAVRLQTLVELRRLYRNCLRAQALLAYPSPVFQPPEQVITADSTQEVINAAEEAEQLAIWIVAEMQLTSEQMKASLRALPFGLVAVFPNATDASEEKVRDKAQSLASELKARAAMEIKCLPFSSESEAQQVLNLRNSRYRRSASSFEQEAVDSEGRTISARIGQAEKVAEKFVAKQLKPVLKKAQESDIMEVVRESSSYLKGLWTRLNGGKSGSPETLLQSLALPIPSSVRKDMELAITQLSLDLEGLEKRLQEESKTRESKLRNAGIAGRVQMAMQLKLMDSEILALSRQLAVKTLMLEMQHIYRALEEEALEIVRDIADWKDAAVVQREGSTEELAVLVAEFGLLDEQLTVLAATVQDGTLLLGGDDILEKLAVEIPDMRSRVGVPDQVVYGGSGFSLTKARLQFKEALDKLAEGANFMLRGLRLLQSDMSNALRLFTKAATGGSLKAREVTSLRRTARDILTFIPFTIILIIPLTPLGHVLVFGFIQRYFPSFFPSQFSTKRQQIMMRYEELKSQLIEAQARAEQEEEEAELRRATAAVMRLTAPEPRNRLTAPNNGELKAEGGSQQEGPLSLDGNGTVRSTAAKKLELLQQKVMEVEEEVHSGDELEGANLVKNSSGR